jgi:hypothetical protein
MKQEKHILSLSSLETNQRSKRKKRRRLTELLGPDPLG